MNNRDLANIVFKAMGLYWLVSAIQHITHGALIPFSDMGMGNLPGNILKFELINWILTGALYGVLSYVLLFRTQYAIDIMKLKLDKDEIMNSSMPTIDYKRLSFTIVGVYFLVPAMSAIIPQVVTVLSLRQSPPGAGMFQASYLEKSWTGLLENSTQLIISVILIIGGAHLKQLWLRLRPLSSSAQEESEDKE